ncbi:MAG: ATP-binding cassette domain-containing protein, partial [Bifidobacteriaceae bacterium]|nr:ATP-binding cassette domain-containing protein [Bifidobacteriaceae bacterium]
MTGVPALELRGITKKFGDFIADENISLRIMPGEVFALLGENGAGKSTLMNVCYGILQPTTGQILLEGQPVTIPGPTAARMRGIGMVHQHFKLVPSLTVADNVFLGAEPTTKWRSLDRESMTARVAEVSERYGLRVEPNATVDTLSAGMRQRVEIVKALCFDAKILILDEPTAVLTPQECVGLFEVLRQLSANDRSVVLITHKLPEVKAVSDRVAVLRRGRLVSVGPTSDFSESQLATLMVGRHVDLARKNPPPAERVSGASALICRELVLSGPDNRLLLDRVSFDLRGGEITGLAGVEGNGQTELVETIAGLRTPDNGRISLNGVDITTMSPAGRRSLGLAHIPEDRVRSGVSTASSVQANIVGGFLKSMLFRLGFVRPKPARQWVERIIQRYDVRGARAPTRVGELSGGNMQKVVVARELESTPSVLLAAQPTRGIDIGATEFVHERLREQAVSGGAVLLVSADLTELLNVSDRILVMYKGRVVAQFEPEESLVPRIGLAMAGAADERDQYHPPEPSEPLGAPQFRPDSIRATLDEPLIEPGNAARSSSFVERSIETLSQPILAVGAALVVGLLIIIALGANPGQAFESLLLGSFRSEHNLSGMIAQATPLLIIAVSVYVSFTAGIFNVGAEGQMYLGSFFGAYTALTLSDLPGPLLIILCFLAGALAGACWALLPGVLNAYFNVDILVSTLMFNYIGISLTTFFVSGGLRDPAAGITGTRTVPEQAWLPTLLGYGGANIGIFIGVALLAVTGFVVKRSSWGLQARFVGENREFARNLG